VAVCRHAQQKQASHAEPQPQQVDCTTPDARPFWRLFSASMAHINTQLNPSSSSSSNSSSVWLSCAHISYTCHPVAAVTAPIGPLQLTLALIVTRHLPCQYTPSVVSQVITEYAVLCCAVLCCAVLCRGLLFFAVLVLIGTGWSYMKPFIDDRTRQVLMIVIPLQVIGRVGKGEGGESGCAGDRAEDTLAEHIAPSAVLPCTLLLTPPTHLILTHSLSHLSSPLPPAHSTITCSHTLTPPRSLPTWRW